MLERGHHGRRLRGHCERAYSCSDIRASQYRIGGTLLPSWLLCKGWACVLQPVPVQRHLMPGVQQWSGIGLCLLMLSPSYPHSLTH